MPYTVEDYLRDVARRYVDQLPPEERLKGLSIDEVLRRFPTDEILGRFPTDQRLKGLSSEEVRAYLEKLEKHQKSSREA